MIIVTGGSRGIGAAICRQVAASCPVVVNYANQEQAANEVVQSIVSAGGRAIAVQADVAREADILRLFETAEHEFGTITGLVNNAGVTGGFALVRDVQAEAIAEVLARKRHWPDPVFARSGAANEEPRLHRQYFVPSREDRRLWRMGPLRRVEGCREQFYDRTGKGSSRPRNSCERRRARIDRYRPSRNERRARQAGSAVADCSDEEGRRRAGSGGGSGIERRSAQQFPAVNNVPQNFAEADQSHSRLH